MRPPRRQPRTRAISDRPARRGGAGKPFAALEAARTFDAGALASRRLPVRTSAHDGRRFSVTGLKHVSRPELVQVLRPRRNKRAGSTARRPIARPRFETAEAARGPSSTGTTYIDEPPAGGLARKRRLNLSEPSDDDESRGRWEPSDEEDEEDAAEEARGRGRGRGRRGDDDDDDTPAVYAAVGELATK